MRWQCPSVRPSEFFGLFSTCFEISFSNLVYTFSMWHDMSSLSFIDISSVFFKNLFSEFWRLFLRGLDFFNFPGFYSTFDILI